LRDQTCPNPDCLYLHRVGNDRDSFIKVINWEKCLFIEKDETSNNKNVFIDQQKMAVEHLQKHLPEIEKSISNQKPGKTLFPSMGTVRMKIKDFIKQNTVEKEPIKEPETAKTEEKKTKANEIETLKEKITVNIEKSPENNKKSANKEESTAESKKESEEPIKDDKAPVKPVDNKAESPKEEEELSKPALQSNKSSFSCQSTNENENSSKKETLTEQKENGIQNELDQTGDNLENNETGDLKKQGQIVRNSSESESNKENIDFTQQIFRTFSRESKNDGINYYMDFE